jgi:hypothetical protein
MKTNAALRHRKRTGSNMLRDVLIMAVIAVVLLVVSKAVFDRLEKRGRK